MLKAKIIYVILSILSFGIYPYILKKRFQNKPANVLSEAKKITINLDELIECLGGKNNINGAEYTHTKTKIFVSNIELVNKEKIDKIKGISGIFISSNKIFLNIGNQAKLFTQQLIKKVS